MAITNIPLNTYPEKGIDYTIITDTSADWAGVANDTYFYDLGDRLPHYKNASGTLLDAFSESGGGGINLYNTSDSLTSARTIDFDGNTFKFTDTSAGFIGSLVYDFNTFNGTLTETYYHSGSSAFAETKTNTQWSLKSTVLDSGIEILSQSVAVKMTTDFKVEVGASEKFKVNSSGELFTNGTQGFTGTYLIANGDTVTVTNGLITNVAP